MKVRKAAYLQITRKCNNECVFCSNPQFDKDYSLEESKKTVLEFEDDGVTEILLTGGEPTIVEFLPDLIAFIKNRGINPKIITNGVELSNKAFVRKLYDVGLKNINVSIHSCNEEVVDKLSQKKGHFKKSLLGIRNALALGIDVTLNSTINSLNCNHLSNSIKFFIKTFPEIKHYVFNNLDPGKADGTLKSRAGENQWVVAKLVDLELELHKAVKILKNSNKTFRIERVPLCYMQGFEEFSTETRKIVKDELYICSFIEKSGGNKIRTVSPTQLRTKVKSCKKCKLDGVCAGVQQEYLDIYGGGELFSVFKDLDEIESKIINFKTIVMHKGNYQNLQDLVYRFNGDDFFVFKLMSPKEARRSGLTHVLPHEVIANLKRVIKGIKHYKVLDIPFCLLNDHNVSNPITPYKIKIGECSRCYYDSKCGGIYKDSGDVKEVLNKLSMVDSSKCKLIQYVGTESNTTSNKFHSLGILNSTSICDLDCVFCNESELRKKPEHIPLDIIKKNVIELKKRGVTSINFMGGEVTTRPDIMGLLDYVKNEGLNVGIATNCLRFKDKSLCEGVLKIIDFMEISLHAVDEKTFKNLYRSNRYNDFIGGLSNLAELNKKYKKKIIINVLISSFNYEKLIDIVEFVVKNLSENSAIHFRMIENEGSAKMNPHCMVSFGICRAGLFKAVDLGKKNNLSMKIDNIPPCLLKGYEEYSRMVLESTQKLNQYYFNKMKLKDCFDYGSYKNKHLVSTPTFKQCRACVFDFLCRGLADDEFLDKHDLLKEIKPIKDGVLEIIQKTKNNTFLTHEI